MISNLPIYSFGCRICLYIVILTFLQSGTKAWPIVKAPVDVLSYNSHIGSQYCFLITGFTTQFQPKLEGDLIYPASMALSATSVYEGYVTKGESAQILVQILPGQSSYGGGTRNGVKTDASDEPYHLSYKFIDYCCEDGKFNTARSRSCSACQTGCQTCTGSANNCQSCIAGYGLYGSNCQTCEGTFYKDSTSPCLACPVGCKTCDQTNKNICLECEKGYYYQSSKCFKCPTGKASRGGTDSSCGISCSENCDECEDSKVCTTCSTGYFLDDTETGTQCSACSYLCDACTDAKTCQICHAGSILVRSILASKYCIKCGPNTFSNGITCVSCPKYCIDCIDENECHACINGYVLNSNSTCDIQKGKSGLPSQAVILISVVGGIGVLAAIFILLKFMTNSLISKTKID